jgi:hypothetical protein
MKNPAYILWIKVAFMLVSLVGVILTMSYFRSGQAFKNPDPVTQVLLGNSADSSARPAKIIVEKPTSGSSEAGQDPQKH